MTTWMQQALELSWWVSLLWLGTLALSWVFRRWSGSDDIHIAWTGITWSTQRAPDVLHRMAKRWPRFWNAWFACGGLAAVFGMLVGTAALWTHLGWMLSLSNVERREATPALMPVIPGLNMPFSDLFYYFGALLISGVVHEAGHALCALVNRCAVDGMGVAVFFVVPAAFTDVRRGDLEASPRVVHRNVLGAGAWHNFALCVVAMLLISALPVLLMPFYSQGHGMSVVRAAPGLVEVGSVVQGLNGCPVRNERDWRQCFSEMMGMTHQSFCVAKDVLHASKDDHDCCEVGYQGGLQCFNQRSWMYCLSARLAVKGGSCNLTHLCDPLSECVDASRTSVDERIMWITTISDSGGGHVNHVMAGEPAWLWRSVTLSPFVPRFATRILGGLDLKLMRLLGYIISMSGALGVLNLLPIHFLDGSHILDVLFAESFLMSQTLYFFKTACTAALLANLILSTVPQLFAISTANS